MRPLASGLEAVVRCNFVPNAAASCSHRVDVKLEPRSLTIVSVTPCLETYWIRALAHVSAVGLDMGIASGHLVFLSIIEKRYL